MKSKSGIVFTISFLFLTFLSTPPSSASLIYTSSNLNPKTANLVVAIHGCLQDPDSMALGTGWNALADKNNLIVLYPKVAEGKNDLGCWSWYLEENQSAKSGELKEIKTEIEATIKRFQLKKPKVFLAGLSSGGTTVAGLLACYPKYFAAAAIHSAPSYGLAKTKEDAQKLLKEGPSEIKLRNECDTSKNTASVLVIQGLDDKVVNPAHGMRTIEDFVGTKESKSSEKKSEGDLKYEVLNFEKKPIKAQLVMIEGMGHSWPGFGSNFSKPLINGPKGKYPTTVPFFIEKGPNSTGLIWEFFRSH